MKEAWDLVAKTNTRMSVYGENTNDVYRSNPERRNSYLSTTCELLLIALEVTDHGTGY